MRPKIVVAHHLTGGVVFQVIVGDPLIVLVMIVITVALEVKGAEKAALEATIIMAVILKNAPAGSNALPLADK